MAADTFTKLFSGIIASTVWQEPDSTRLTWITMLAMADKDGVVAASVPGLAHMARVSLPQCEAALATFLAPDPYSRTPDHDGRRIEAVPGGWLLLNHGLYRGRRDDEAQRERKREWDRRNRPSGHARAKQSDAQSDDGPPRSAEVLHIAEAEAEAEASKAKATVHSAAPTAPSDDDLPEDGLGLAGDPPMPAAPIPADDPPEVPKRITGEKKPQTAARFPEFWAAYPVKKGRADALKKWKAKGLDPLADQIIAHVRKMEAEDDTWKRGFVPHGSTYINGERWTDEPTKDKPAEGKPNEPSGKLPAASDVMRQGESKLEAALGYVRQCYHRGDFGEGEDAKAMLQQKLAEATERHRVRDGY